MIVKTDLELVLIRELGEQLFDGAARLYAGLLPAYDKDEFLFLKFVRGVVGLSHDVKIPIEYYRTGLTSAVDAALRDEIAETLAHWIIRRSWPDHEERTRAVAWRRWLQGKGSAPEE